MSTRPAPTEGGDRLVPLSEGAARLGCSVWTLKRRYAGGLLPVVISEGGWWSTYESFIKAILASARPGKAGVWKDVAGAWFAEHGTEAVA